MRKLGFPADRKFECQRPVQPLLIHLVNFTKKGCSAFYRFLRKKINLATSLGVRENKWQVELNCFLSTEFWNNTYRLAADIKNDNRFKWLQYQINRNSLYTNYKVHKFDASVNPHCTFCLQKNEEHPALELVSHLFEGCRVVKDLWLAVGDWLGSLGIKIPVDKSKRIFGCQAQPVTSVSNYVILAIKYYIWFSRLNNHILNLTAFKKYLLFKLDELKNAFIYEKKEHKFNQWSVVYENLVSYGP